MFRWLTICSFVVMFSVLVLAPLAVLAQGLVPSCPVGEPGCAKAYHPDNYGACEMVQMANNILRFLIGLISVIGALVMVYAGYLLVSSRGNVSQMQRAKEMFTNILIGIVIMLSAFLVVNTVMSILVGSDSSLLNWNNIDCGYALEAGKAETKFDEIKVTENTLSFPDAYYDAYTPVVDGDMYPGGGAGVAAGSCSASGLEVGDACYAPNRCKITVTSGVCTRISPYQGAIAAAASKYGVPASRIMGVMITESGGNPSAQSPAGAIGLMQIMPGTGSAACGLSASDLLDPLKNIDCGAKYYAEQYKKFGNHNLAAAAYNAGPGSNGPSADCPGLTKWQCPFNAGGCCVSGKVTAMTCAINTGYQETRAYVDKVNAASPVCR